MCDMEILRQLRAVDVEYSGEFPRVTAMKKLPVKEFGSDWPSQKLLCYDLRAAVVNTLSCLELIANHKHENTEVEKALNLALKNTQFAAQKVEELFREICEADKPR
jgi:hypothetical protein